MRKTIHTLLFLVIALSLGACSLTSNPTEAPTPNIEPTLNAARTEAAATVAAQVAAQPSATPLPATATLAPSATTAPTNTEVPTIAVQPTNTPLPLPTNTAVPTLRPTSAISSTPVSLSCTITASAGGGARKPGEDFDGSWTAKNTGSDKWLASSVDYKYSSGTKMYKFEGVYDLPGDVAPGDSIDIRVDMTAPTTPGIYTSNWIIVDGAKVLCNLPIQIVVK